MSSPLMIRMRDFLKSSRPDPRPDFYFAALVFHEMLHRYLEKNFNRFLDERRSPLFQKYASEHGGVLVHIHLFGVLKTIYIQLKLEGELEKIIEWDSEIAGPVYKRSWEIVNTEGHEKFVNELKGPRPGRNH